MKLPLPLAALAQHVIGLGKTGSGKSSKMRLIVEALFDAGKAVTLIDPKGDWWGIKSSADGKRAGYPVVIFGGEHADVPLNAHAGAHVAELVATGNRPCLIDLGGWTVGDRTRFFIDFASTLFRTTRGSRYLLIDEVHNFAPKGKIFDVEAGKCLHWANRLASEGRGKGITIIAASQRPQKVHNDFLTSCETLIAGRVIHKADRDAIKDWIDGCADPEKGKEVMAQLASMQRNEAWCWSPEINFGPERLAFPLFKTYDSFKPQEHHAKLKGWAEVDLEEVKTKLASVVEEAKANDPGELRRQVADLKRQLAGRAPVEKTVEKVVEVPMLKDAQLARVEKFAQVFAQHSEKLIAEAGELRRLIVPANWPNPLLRLDTGRRPPLLDAKSLRAKAMLDHFNTRPTPPAVNRGNGSVEADSRGAKRRVMIALAQNPDGLAWRKLAILSDVKEGGSTWRGAFAALRRDGHVEDSGHRFSRLTSSGVHALGAYEPLPIGAALIEHWRAKMGNSTRYALFNAIIAAYPNSISSHDAATQAGIDLGGSTWRSHMAYFRGLELVSGSDQLKASEDLFG